MPKPVIPTVNDDGAQGSTDPAEKLYRIPGLVTSTDLAVIRRSVILHLASIADMDDDSAESSGRALAEICRGYLRAEREMRKGGNGG